MVVVMVVMVVVVVMVVEDVATAVAVVMVVEDVATAVVVGAMVVVMVVVMVEAADNAGLRYITFICQAVDDDLTNSAKMYTYTCSCSVMSDGFYRTILMFLLPRSLVYL